MAKEFQSLKGQFLLDGGELRGSFFHRTVVLMCAHDPQGALGLVLNRSMDRTLEGMITEELPPGMREEPLFLGGPVQPSALSFLYSGEFLSDALVIDDVALGHSFETLIECGESMAPKRRLRVFAGYAGWGPGQLEEELRRKAWLMHAATADLVFDSNPEQLWRTILKRMGWPFQALADAPEDLSFN